MSIENAGDGNNDSGIGDGIDNGNGGIAGIEIGKPIGRIDPASASGSDSGSGDNGRRTRSDKGSKRGKRNAGGSAASTPAEEKTLRLDVLTGILLSLHTMAAVKIPEMEMTQAEAEAVATAYMHVAEFHPALQQSAKAAAYTELLSVAGMVYGMRLVAIRNNWNKPKEERAATVLPFDPTKRDRKP
jgi:hypothetical protein